MTTLTKTPSVTIADPLLAAIELYVSLVTSFFSLSLAENALVTGLLISKILTVYRDIRGLESRVGYTNGLGCDVVRIIYILIESGMITFVAQLVQTLIYKFANNAYPIIGGCMFQLYVRSFSQLLIQWVLIIYLSDYAGNFDGNRTFACRDGPYLRGR